MNANVKCKVSAEILKTKFYKYGKNKRKEFKRMERILQKR